MAGMPFDPDAYLARKTASAASAPSEFDPDAYLARRGVHGPWEKYQTAAPAATPSAFDPDAYLERHGVHGPTVRAPAQSEPPDNRGILRKVYDTARAPGEMARTMASSILAAPIADVAGLAATGYEWLARGAHGNGDMPSGFRDYVRDRLTYAPTSPEARSAARTLGGVAAPIVDAGGRMADAVRGDAPGNSVRGMLTNAAIEGAQQAPGFLGLGAARAVPRVVSAAERGANVLTGSAARAARDEATTAARGALGDIERGHAATQSAKITEAQAYEDAAARAGAELRAAAQRAGVPTVDVLGGQVRDAYLKVMTDAKAARTKAVEPVYAKAKAAAAAREAQGQFIDVRPALTDIDEMLKDSAHLPDLQRELLRLKQSVQGAAPKAAEVAPPGHGKVSSRMRTQVAPATPAHPLSYAELDSSARFIKDIAFSGEAEGYGALIRNAAKRLSVKLDEQIAKQVPEHAAATALYRKLSEPMETLGTRIGAALHDTEGGLKGDAYGKVSAQDLPARIFGRKDRIEQLVDSLAGGKGAKPEARAAAQAKVDTWVENWILDSTTGKVGAAASKEIAAPGMRATLNAAPGARDRLAGTFAREAAHERAIPELGKAAEAARAEAHAAQSQRVKVRSQLAQADVDLAHGSAQDAYRGYVSALRSSMSGADPAKYRAAIALIERAGDLEAKTAKAQRLARHFVYGATAAAGINEARKVLQ